MEKNEDFEKKLKNESIIIFCVNHSSSSDRIFKKIIQNA